MEKREDYYEVYVDNDLYATCNTFLKAADTASYVFGGTLNKNIDIYHVRVLEELMETW